MKKTDCDTKISEIENKVSDHNHDKYITSPEFNILAARVFNARLAQVNLVAKIDFDTKVQEFNKKLNSNKTKRLLVENELKKLNNFDAAYFKGKNFFGDDGTQNYLVFQKMNRCFKKIDKTRSISLWKSKGLSDEVIKSPTIDNNSLAPKLEYLDKKMLVKFDESCLVKQDEFTFNEKTANIYIAYDLDSNLNNFDPTLQHFLFGAVKLTKNRDIDKYQYSGYGIGFDSKGTFSQGTFSHLTGSFGQNPIIFGVDMSSSTHATNRAKKYSSPWQRL